MAYRRSEAQPPAPPRRNEPRPSCSGRYQRQPASRSFHDEDRARSTRNSYDEPPRPLYNPYEDRPLPPPPSSSPPPQYGYGEPPRYSGHHGPPAHYGYPGYYPPPGGYGYPPPGGYGYPLPPAYGGSNRQRSRSPRESGGKYTCKFLIGIENDSDFRVSKKLIGPGGNNMKDIWTKTGGDAKLRLRGKGSGHKEQKTNEESSEPLQVCISCTSKSKYQFALHAMEDLIVGVYEQYDQWCAETGKDARAPAINIEEDYIAGGGALRDKPEVEDTQGKGTPHPDAPSHEEIERLIHDRNEARRGRQYSEADRIRDDLLAKGVVLLDEKKAKGEATSVTAWRYWKEQH